MNKWGFFILIIIIIIAGCRQKPVLEPVNDLLSDKTQVNGSEAGTFNLLIDRSRLEKKNLFLVFAFRGCGICRIFDNYHNDTIVKEILGKYFIIRKIDINRTPGGKEIYTTYGKTGFPSWTIIDSTKTVIVDSGNLKDRKGNIGFPNSERDRDYYISAVKKAAAPMTQAEADILVKKIKEYRPDRIE
jgi:hypothetical protein